MKNNERDALLIRLDERTKSTYEKMEELRNYIIVVDRKTQNLKDEVASTRWHGWAIKGGIAGTIGLAIERLSQLFR